MRLAILLVLPVTLALGGCPGSDPPPPEIRYVPVTMQVKPVVASECFADDPKDPYLAGPTDVDAARHIDDLKGQRRALKKLRRVCAASLTANGLGPGK